MTFRTFEISELSEDSENDYALEIQASQTKWGILVTEEEMQMLGDAILRTVEDGGAGEMHASDYVDSGSVDCVLCDETSETVEEYEQHMAEVHDDE